MAAKDGSEFNPVDRFYEKDEYLGDENCTEIIAERLNLRHKPQGISETLEHQLKLEKRSDYIATKIIKGKRQLFVPEVKEQ